MTKANMTVEPAREQAYDELSIIKEIAEVIMAAMAKEGRIVLTADALFVHTKDEVVKYNKPQCITLDSLVKALCPQPAANDSLLAGALQPDLANYDG